MKKSHIWDVEETLHARCPYCGKRKDEVCGAADEGDITRCHHCDKLFELGRPE